MCNSTFIKASINDPSPYIILKTSPYRDPTWQAVTSPAVTPRLRLSLTSSSLSRSLLHQTLSLKELTSSLQNIRHTRIIRHGASTRLDLLEGPVQQGAQDRPSFAGEIPQRSVSLIDAEASESIEDPFRHLVADNGL